LVPDPLHNALADLRNIDQAFRCRIHAEAKAECWSTVIPT
jgi:hypothetical protein